MTNPMVIDNTGNGKSSFHNEISQTQRLIDMDFTSSNRHDVSIKWLDTKMDPDDQSTQLLLNQLNDHVDLFNDIQNFLNHVNECQETILLIVSGKCAKQCLHLIHSLSSIDSIIIYCTYPDKYRGLMNDTYTKILDCIASAPELIQFVHKWIDLKCQLHFYTWNKEENFDILTRQTALFLANYLLPKCIEDQAYRIRKQEMVKICLAYYAQRPSEFDHIREFELTYTPADAIYWYTRNTFVHKIVNRALRSFDSIKLRAIAFYIQDLRSQLREWHLTTSSKETLTVYHGLVMTKCDIKRLESTPAGSLLSTNGFLSTSRKREIAVAFAIKKQNTQGQPLHNVLLEINLGVDRSPIIFADIGRVSAFPEEDEILFDMGTILCLQEVSNDVKTGFYTIKLTIANQTDCDSIKRLLKKVTSELEEQSYDGCQASLIGKLLDVQNLADEPCKKQDDRWQNFSLLRSAVKSLWHSNHDIYKQLFDEPTALLINKLWQGIQQLRNKSSKPNCSNKCNDLPQYNELSLGRFEPILFFCFNDKFIRQEKENLSSIFKLQYRRFTTEHLTVAKMDETLAEYYYIFYISPELPSCMTENRRVKFYELQLPSDDQDPNVKTKLMQRLIIKLLHDLGMFYSQQAKSLSDEKEKPTITKELLVKGANCYQLLANESEKIIQRYKNNKT